MSAPTDTWIQTLSQMVPPAYIPHVIYFSIALVAASAIVVIVVAESRSFKKLQDKLTRSVEQAKRNDQ